MNSSQLLSLYLRVIGTLNCITIGIVVWLILVHLPVNHIGFDPKWLWCLAVIGVGCWVGLRNQQGSRLALIAVSSWVLLCLTLALMDYFNVLLQYDEWLSREMPNPWTTRK